MADVFISYKREDRRLADALAVALRQLGFEVWWDFDLLSGDQYRKVIGAVIDQCRAAIVLWSEKSVESDFVLDEATYAKARGKLCPARIDGVALPFGFGGTHADDLCDWDGELSHHGFQSLVRAVETRVGKKGRLGAASQSVEAQAGSAELESFKMTQLAGSLSALRSFLRDYPNGLFAGFVRKQIESLEEPPQTPPPLPFAPASQPPPPVSAPPVPQQPVRSRWFKRLGIGALVGAALIVLVISSLPNDGQAGKGIQQGEIPPVADNHAGNTLTDGRGGDVATNDNKTGSPQGPRDTASQGDGDEKGSQQRGWLGVSLGSVDQQIARLAGLSDTRGAYITEVVPSSPARSADLKLGDIVLTINGETIQNADAAIKAIAAIPPGRPIDLGILRGVTFTKFSVRLGSFPDDKTLESLRTVPEPATLQAVEGILAPEEFNIARWMDLSFYPSTQVWEFGEWGHDALVSYLVPSSGAPILLDGTSPRIHQYNSQVRLSLTNAIVAADYLRFFNAYVWGEDGAFRLIESENNLPSSVRGTPKSRFKALRLEQNGENYESDAIVIYADQIFEARYRLKSSGVIEMLNDKPLGAVPKDILFAKSQRRPASREGLKVSEWPLPPPIPGTWRNASFEELGHVRQLILTNRAR